MASGNADSIARFGNGIESTLFTRGGIFFFLFAVAKMDFLIPEAVEELEELEELGATEELDN